MPASPIKLRARDLRVGVRYLHINGGFIRENIAIEGETVRWRDQLSSGECSKGAFLKRVQSIAEHGEASLQPACPSSGPDDNEFTVRDEANVLTACAFRNGFIEELHAGKTSPLFITPGYSRISDAEMKRLMIEASTKLAELLLMKAREPERYENFVRRYLRDYCSGWKRD